MKSLFGRTANGNHHNWISRDYEDIDCKAISCKFNLNEKCMVPTKCKIDNTGKCVGFEIREKKDYSGD